MAEVYTKGSKKTLILSNRELVLRPFNFSDWEEIRLGFYFSNVSSSGPDNLATAETVAQSTVADKIMFGIKDDSDDIPGEGNSMFIGIGTHSGESSQLTVNDGNLGWSRMGGGTTSNRGMCGLTTVGATVTENTAVGSTAIACYDAFGANGQSGFACLRIVVNDKGLSTQSVSLSWLSGNQNTKYTISDLTTDMNNMTGSEVSLGADLAWNDGSSAYDLPNNFYLRTPFYNNRIRLLNMQAIRYS